MRRAFVVWICPALATTLAVLVLYWFGVSLLTILLALLLLTCPVVVVWVSWRYSCQWERDLNRAIDRGRKARDNR